MKVYKFLNAQYALDAILSGKLKLSKVDELNDPYEFKGVKFINAVENDNQSIINIIKSKWAFLCVSKNYSNATMWSHYSDSHKGIVLGFEIEKKLENQHSNVKYRSKIKINSKTFEELNTEIEHHSINELLYIKSKDWKYEKELRFVFDLKDCTLKHIMGDIKFFINFEEEGLILKEVIFGCRFNSNIEDKIKIHLRKNENIKLYKAYLHEKLFEIYSEEIT
jgi:hypothetical protein